MKILQICAAYKPAYIYGGPTMSVSLLSEQLAVAGISVEVFTTTANGKNELTVVPGATVLVDGVTVTYFKRITKDHTHLSPALFKTLWNRAKEFDAIHIHTWWNLVSLFSCAIALAKGVPVFFSARGTLSPYSFNNKNSGLKTLIHRLFTKPLLSRTHLHVTSPREQQAMLSLVIPKSINLLPNFILLPKFKQAIIPHPVTGEFKLLFFGRIDEKKGLDILLDALPLLKFNYSLTVAGDGDAAYVDRLKTIASNLHIDTNIHWIGFYNGDKAELLHRHHLFVLPSHDENFGNAVIESLSVGTAVLLSEQVGLADYVAKNNLGWICQANADAIGAATNRIHQKEMEELKRIREIAPGIINSDFSAGMLVKKYLDMYQKNIG